MSTASYICQCTLWCSLYHSCLFHWVILWISWTVTWITWYECSPSGVAVLISSLFGCVSDSFYMFLDCNLFLKWVYWVSMCLLPLLTCTIANCLTHHWETFFISSAQAGIAAEHLLWACLLVLQLLNAATQIIVWGQFTLLQSHCAEWVIFYSTCC